MMIKRLYVEPYRLFFVLGAIWAVVGVSSVMGPLASLHRYIQFYGFLAAFVFGFLGTAFPKMSQSYPLKGPAFLCLVGMHVATMTALLGGFIRTAHGLFAGTLAFFMMQLYIRFRHRHVEVPPFFLFIPIGFSLGIGGSLLQLFPSTAQVGWLWVSEGWMMALVLGVGGFLISSILGVGKVPEKKMIVITASLFAVSFVCDLLNYPIIGLFLRALSFTVVSMNQWRPFQIPNSQKVSTLTLFFSQWSFIVGLWSLLVFPQWRIGALHLIYIGGYGLTTFAIATRVILNHGGFSKLLTGNNRYFQVSMGILVVALICRVVAMWNAAMILVSMGFWILGVGLWSFSFVWRACFPILPVKPEAFKHHRCCGGGCV